MSFQRTWPCLRAVVLAATLGLLQCLSLGLVGSPQRAHAQDTPVPTEAELRENWKELGERAQWVNYDVVQLHGSALFCTRKEAAALEQLLQTAWEEQSGAERGSLLQLQTVIESWMATRASLPPDLAAGRVNPGQVAKIRLRGNGQRLEFHRKGIASVYVTTANAGCAVMIRAGERGVRPPEVASVGGPMPKTSQGMIQGFPWQLLGGSGVSHQLTTSDALNLLLLQQSRGPAEHAFLPSEATAPARSSEATARIWIQHDPDTLPLPRRAWHLDINTIENDRAQVSVWGWAVSNVRFMPSGDADDLPVQLPPGYRIAWRREGRRESNGNSDEPERWPDLWFEVFHPPPGHEDLLALRADGELSDAQQVDLLRAALDPLNASYSIVWSWALLTLLMTVGSTWWITKRVRSANLRAAAVGGIILLGTVLALLSLRLEAPSTVWCLMRSPTFGAGWIVCDEPDGLRVSGSWLHAADRSTLYRARATTVLDRLPVFMRSGRSQLYAPTKLRRDTKHGTWQAFVPFE